LVCSSGAGEAFGFDAVLDDVDVANELERDVRLRRVGRRPRSSTSTSRSARTAHRFIVPTPDTNPLQGTKLPEKAPSVFVVGNFIGMAPNVSVEVRAKMVERMRKAPPRRPPRQPERVAAAGVADIRHRLVARERATR
jgi:hypothetical protein